MPEFTAMIQKFSSKGEKSGWTFISIPKDLNSELKIKGGGSRVKGSIDHAAIEKMAAFPVGDGEYILALNSQLRKKLGKKDGAMVRVVLEADTASPLTSLELLACLEDDREALKSFEALSLSHRNYFHRYVFTAKGENTRAQRIANVISAMHRKLNFSEMLREQKK